MKGIQLKSFKVKLLAIVLAYFGFVPLGIYQANAAGNLGIGVSILPSGDKGGADLGNNSQLWFSLKPGSSQSREFIVTSSGNINQEVKLQLLSLNLVNGVAKVNTEQEAEAAQWVSFEPKNLVLKPHSTTRMKMTFNIPADTKFGRYDGFLRVIAQASDLNGSQSKAKVSAVISNAVAFDQQFWLGVGDGKYLSTDFDMKAIRGIIRGDQKFIQIAMQNLGGTPIGPEGTAELQDAVFTKNHLGPIAFGTATVEPGKTRWAEFEVPNTVKDGRWNIFVTAHQGNVVKTKMFEEDIKFVEESNGLHLPWQLILVIGFGALLLIGIRMVISPRNFNFKLKKPIKSQSSPLEQLSIEELEALIESRTGEIKKRAQKVPAKKPASKQAVKKKAAKKPVKKAAKKATAKSTSKVGAKKVAKKAVKKSAKKATKSRR
ncbi:MAG: hypothetical protein RL129_1449 [Actinomycetota bacterium]